MSYLKCIVMKHHWKLLFFIHSIKQGSHLFVSWTSYETVIIHKTSKLLRSLSNKTFLCFSISINIHSFSMSLFEAVEDHSKLSVALACPADVRLGVYFSGFGWQMWWDFQRTIIVSRHTKWHCVMFNSRLIKQVYMVDVHRFCNL